MYIFLTDKKPHEADEGYFGTVDPEEHSFLFFNQFNIKTSFEYVEAGENRESYDNYFSEEYAKLQVNFPMISRIKDYYEDAVFSKDEISELSREIKLLENLAINQLSKNFLNQISSACKTAQKNNVGMVLVVD